MGVYHCFKDFSHSDTVLRYFVVLMKISPVLN